MICNHGFESLLAATMMRMENRKTPLWIEVVGWYGPIAFIIGFALVSFGVIEARGYIFQLLNLTGGLSIIAISLSKKVYQSVVLNGFLVIIATITLVQLIWSKL
jgi:hypothetical protein